jgi:hypothetical protein
MPDTALDKYVLMRTYLQQHNGPRGLRVNGDEWRLPALLRSLQGEVRTLRAELDALKASVKSDATATRRRVTPDQVWLSSRQTASFLQISVSRTLPLLVQAKLLSRRPYLNGYRFERCEVEQLKRAGLPATATLRHLAAACRHPLVRRRRRELPDTVQTGQLLRDWRPPRR